MLSFFGRSTCSSPLSDPAAGAGSMASTAVLSLRFDRVDRWLRWLPATLSSSLTLTKTLTWRAQAKPLELVTKAFSKDKFAGLGYVTSYGDAADQQKREVFTWNIYGAAAKRMSETFGNLD
ncbi:hypothetical protein BN1723_018769, partial [Verticillium longisporum]